MENPLLEPVQEPLQSNPTDSTKHYSDNKPSLFPQVEYGEGRMSTNLIPKKVEMLFTKESSDEETVKKEA